MMLGDKNFHDAAKEMRKWACLTCTEAEGRHGDPVTHTFEEVCPRGGRPPSSPLADSGEREVAVTGAMREPNHLRFDLIPYEALDRMAQHYANGAKKYAPRNWEKGLSMQRCFTSAVNHLFKYARNKALNLPMEEDHLAAAAWNIFSMMTYEKRIERGWLPESLDDFDPIAPAETQQG
jgi:hypothetical protein